MRDEGVTRGNKEPLYLEIARSDYSETRSTRSRGDVAVVEIVCALFVHKHGNPMPRNARF